MRSSGNPNTRPESSPEEKLALAIYSKQSSENREKDKDKLSKPTAKHQIREDPQTNAPQLAHVSSFFPPGPPCFGSCGRIGAKRHGWAFQSFHSLMDTKAAQQSSRQPLLLQSASVAFARKPTRVLEYSSRQQRWPVAGNMGWPVTWSSICLSRPEKKKPAPSEGCLFVPSI